MTVDVDEHAKQIIFKAAREHPHMNFEQIASCLITGRQFPEHKTPEELTDSLLEELGIKVRAPA